MRDERLCVKTKSKKRRKKKGSMYIAPVFINVVYVLGVLAALGIGHMHTFLCMYKFPIQSVFAVAEFSALGVFCDSC